MTPRYDDDTLGDDTPSVSDPVQEVTPPVEATASDEPITDPVNATNDEDKVRLRITRGDAHNFVCYVEGTKITVSGNFGRAEYLRSVADAAIASALRNGILIETDEPVAVETTEG